MAQALAGKVLTCKPLPVPAKQLVACDLKAYNIK
jgi:hypothetical protein